SGSTRTCARGPTRLKQAPARFSETSSPNECWGCRRVTDLTQISDLRFQIRYFKFKIMDFDLSKPQKLLKDSARELLARECPPAGVRELMETETAQDDRLWQVVADQGWTGLIFSEAEGGLGLGLVELAAVLEETGRACLPGPFLSNLFAGALIARAGNPEQRARYLTPLAAGELKATVAVLEESASWDPDALKLA